uniref:Ig-like domain-containing protein n=1 Tax=Timema cristinae TaxID=61476 RepID=A0A7R9H926_TIMCR|nr:unnamed protein product [Timema cristinae]
MFRETIATTKTEFLISSCGSGVVLKRINSFRQDTGNDLPACSPNQPRVIRAAKNETVNITCEVDSNPLEVMFQWMFNNSATALDIHPSHFFQLGTVSLIVYTPLTDLDYGTFQCLAYNSVGRQREPCVVDLVPEDTSEQELTKRFNSPSPIHQWPLPSELHAQPSANNNNIKLTERAVWRLAPGISVMHAGKV